MDTILFAIGFILGVEVLLNWYTYRFAAPTDFGKLLGERFFMPPQEQE